MAVFYTISGVFTFPLSLVSLHRWCKDVQCKDSWWSLNWTLLSFLNMFFIAGAVYCFRIFLDRACYKVAYIFLQYVDTRACWTTWNLRGRTWTPRTVTRPAPCTTPPRCVGRQMPTTGRQGPICWRNSSPKDYLWMWRTQTNGHVYYGRPVQVGVASDNWSSIRNTIRQREMYQVKDTAIHRELVENNREHIPLKANFVSMFINSHPKAIIVKQWIFVTKGNHCKIN